MSILNLTPSLSVCVVNKCTKMNFTDTTGVYHAVTNPGGWGNAATELAANITAATITITDPSGTVLPVVNVLADLPATVVGTFPFSSVTIDSPLDGQWTALYTLTSPGGTVTNTLCFYVTCLVRCCIDTLWSEKAVNLLSECDCAGIPDPLETVLFAESLLGAIESTTACDNSTIRDALLVKLQRLCKLQNCKCK